jgi:hypothetical protein
MPDLDDNVLEYFLRERRPDETHTAESEDFYYAVRERALRLAEQDANGETDFQPNAYGDISFYWLLGVSRDAPLWKIERAYHRFVSENHPDHFTHNGDEQRERARRLSEMNDFMRVLRRRHDRKSQGQ